MEPVKCVSATALPRKCVSATALPMWQNISGILQTLVCLCLYPTGIIYFKACHYETTSVF